LLILYFLAIKPVLPELSWPPPTELS